MEAFETSFPWMVLVCKLLFFVFNDVIHKREHFECELEVPCIIDSPESITEFYFWVALRNVHLDIEYVKSDIDSICGEHRMISVLEFFRKDIKYRFSDELDFLICSACTDRECIYEFFGIVIFSLDIFCKIAQLV